MFLSFGARSTKQAMASRAAFNVIRSLKQRLYSTQTAFKEQARPLSTDVQVTRLGKSGITLATVDCNYPVSWVAIAVNAGPRFESMDNIGISHILRRGIERGNVHDASIKVINTFLDRGANFSCTTNREYMIYSIECLRQDVRGCLNAMKSNVLEPAFYFHEIRDVAKPMENDLALLHSQPDLVLYEMLHSASYAGGLGRSLYAPEEMLGKYSVEQVRNFHKEFYSPDRMAVVGIGVDHQFLLDEYSVINEQSDSRATVSGATAPSFFRGGEERAHLPGSARTFAAVTVEGPSLKSKDNLAASVLQYIMGTGPRNKYGSESNSLLGKTISGATSAPCSVSCISMAYSDSGLFGFSAVGAPSEMDKILKAAFAKFASATKDGTITDADLKRGKNQLKADIAISLETSRNMAAYIGEQILNHGKVTKLDELFEMIDSVTKQDVVNVAKKVVNGKQSMAAIGDLRNTPYLHELNK